MARLNKLHRIQKARELLGKQNLSVRTFSKIENYLKNIDPKLDKRLVKCRASIDALKTVFKDKAVSLDLNRLPDQTQSEKLQKQAVRQFLNQWRYLKEDARNQEKKEAQLQTPPKPKPTTKTTSKTKQKTNKSKTPQIKKGLSLQTGWKFFSIIAVVILAILGLTLKQKFTTPGINLKPEKPPGIKITKAEVKSTQSQLVWTMQLESQQNSIDWAEYQLHFALLNNQGRGEFVKTVDDSGVVTLEQPKTDISTSLTITDIQGPAAWDPENQTHWQSKIAAKFP